MQTPDRGPTLTPTLSPADARKKRVDDVKRTYPDTYQRVRAACVHASTSIDLDHHAAMIVLAARERKT